MTATFGSAKTPQRTERPREPTDTRSAYRALIRAIRIALRYG